MIQMTNKPEQGAEAKTAPGFFSFENLSSLAVLVTLLFAFRWSVLSPYHVPTSSMEPTIHVGDRLLANKLAYNLRVPFTDFVLLSWNTVKRGDIIIFRFPKDTSLDYVKRVVGVAGDKIRLMDDVLYVNGEAQKREDKETERAILDGISDSKEFKRLYQETLGGLDHWVINNIPSRRSPYQSNWPEEGFYTVPENSVFVMGDNRDNSLDSRAWNEVPLSYVKGQAMFVMWSMVFPKDSWIPHFQFHRFFSWLK
ncbi:MAG: signal peptidase I [Oligoflexales bacterium]|nr:signal peptidase I [Oligoflexales bacterium]